MLHWAKSFSLIALGAGIFALGAFAPGLGAAALLVAGVTAALAALALLTGALGRCADGSYSSERALTLAALAVVAVFAAKAWLDHARGGSHAPHSWGSWRVRERETERGPPRIAGRMARPGFR